MSSRTSKSNSKSVSTRQVSLSEAASIGQPGNLPNLRGNMRLGKYKLSRRIGKGGYCQVWKARDTIEGIWVALKIPNTGRDGKMDNQSLLREVRLVAQLRHPNIMPVKNAEIIDGYAVLATELSGGTLDDCSFPMGLKRIISIITQVLEGLSYAHKKRMVHCDVTPGNIFLFPNGRAALGDFGIGFEFSGRPKTVDEFGTPGYVAPEQAYGKPTYRSDCFAVALIVYQYITGVLPRWPFYWPFKGFDRLKGRTSGDFVKFMKKALDIDPSHRFANASSMLDEMRRAIPQKLRKSLSVTIVDNRKVDWQQLRRESFVTRYRKIFGHFTDCVDCGEPVSEFMSFCPWCGSDNNRFDYSTQFSLFCPRCHRGVSPKWRFCPWCYGSGFEPQPEQNELKHNYQTRCRHCGEKLMRFMRYCPSCRRKIRIKWKVFPFPEVCGRCGWSVDSNYWNYCPWCHNQLV
jgi:serine/threonine-protein kinase